MFQISGNFFVTTTAFHLSLRYLSGVHFHSTDSANVA
jgi:hypothetical protein